MAKKNEVDVAALQAEVKRLQKIEDMVKDDEVPYLYGVRLDMVGEIHDPYAVRGNAMSFIAHPHGKKLRWVKESSRNDKGWDGYEIVYWKDEIGQNIKAYTSDAPHKLDNDSDSKVRRGDMVLAWLPVEVWLYRQLERSKKAQAQAQGNTSPEEATLADYKSGVFGEGLTASERPAGGFVPGSEEVSERTERAHSVFDDAVGGNKQAGDNTAAG
jgi:hypothetical protein